MDSLPVIFYESVTSSISSLKDSFICWHNENPTFTALERLNGHFGQCSQKLREERFCLNVDLIFDSDKVYLSSAQCPCLQNGKKSCSNVFEVLKKPEKINLVLIHMNTTFPSYLNQEAFQPIANLEKLFLSLQNVRTSFQAYNVDFSMILQYPSRWMQNALMGFIVQCKIDKNASEIIQGNKNIHVMDFPEI